MNVRISRLCIAAVLGSAAACAWLFTAATPGANSAVAAPAVAGAGPCQSYRGMPEGFGHVRQAGMVRIPAGAVQLGARNGHPEERPTGETLRIAAFWMDRSEVTNAQFAAFVEAAGYVTDAEREGAAAVFQAPRRGQRTVRDGEWWSWRPGANWRQPQGPQSPARAQPNEPVVLVTYADALAYARWLGRDLPTESEWEYAARGGAAPEQIEREPRDPKGRPVANYWQGLFPDMNSTEDGYAALAPVGCFSPNGYGLLDMIGNVWELTRDRYSGPHQPHGNGDPAASIHAAGGTPRRGERLVIKGGSFLCAADYCMRYRATARHPQESDIAASHVGFRTVLRDVPALPRP